jgi:hypothetical protein
VPGAAALSRAALADILFVSYVKDMLTRAQLTKVGEALFGSGWQTDLADALGVTSRTVRRWLAGDTGMPETLPEDLKKLCRARAARLSKLASEL